MADWPLVTNTYIDCAGTDLSAGGILVTPSATAHTKGAWVQFSAALLFDYSRTIVQLNNIVQAANYLVDIGIGGAGAEVVIMSNLGFGGAATTTAYGAGNFDFPVRIQKGTRVAARCQANIASGTGIRMSVLGVGESFRTPSGWSQTQGLGANVATSRGVTVDCGAAANTYGAWAEISSALPNNIAGLVINLPYDLNTAKSTGGMGLEIGIGAAGAEVAVLSGWPFFSNLTQDAFYPVTSPFFPIVIKQGTRVAVRGRSSITDATDRKFDVILHGVV